MQEEEEEEEKKEGEEEVGKKEEEKRTGRGRESRQCVAGEGCLTCTHTQPHTSLTHNDSCLVCRCGGGTGTSGRGCDPSPGTRGSRMGTRS